MHVVRPKKNRSRLDAGPGDKLVYYRGHLAHDRMPSTEALDGQSRITLQAVANRVMAAASQNLILPVQKRIGPEEFLYIAVKALPGRLGSACRAAIPLPSFLSAHPIRLAA